MRGVCCSLFAFLLSYGNRTGGLDEVIGSGGRSEVEERLSGRRQGLAGAGHQHEGTLNGIASVQNSFLSAGHAGWYGRWG